MTPSQALARIGPALKSLRNKLNVSQGNIAAKVGISWAAISRIESGKRLPRLDTLAAICETMNISLSELFKIVEENSDNEL